MRRSLDTQDPGSEARRSRGARHAGAGVCRDARKVREARKPGCAVRKGRGVPGYTEGARGARAGMRGAQGAGVREPGMRGAQGQGCAGVHGRCARRESRGARKLRWAVRRGLDTREPGSEARRSRGARCARRGARGARAGDARCARAGDARCAGVGDAREPGCAARGNRGARHAGTGVRRGAGAEVCRGARRVRGPVRAAPRAGA